MIKYLITFSLLCVLLLTSCFRPNDEIISDGVQRLVIDNAFYVNDIFSCTIQFDYYVTEDTCNVGGFAIRWDAHRSGQTAEVFPRDPGGDAGHRRRSASHAGAGCDIELPC